MIVAIWIGTGLALLGIAGLFLSVRISLNARQPGLEAAAQKAARQRALIWNMAGLGVAAIGLMILVVGIILR